MQDLIEERQSLRRELRLGVRDRHGIEEGVRVARRGARRERESGGQVQFRHLVTHRARQALGEQRPKDRRADGAADVAPELDLAGTHAEVAQRQRALHRIDVERERDAEAGADEDDRDGQRRLRGRGRRLRNQVNAEHHERRPDGAEIVVVLDTHHQVAGRDTGHDQSEHHRGQQQAGVRDAHPEHTLGFQWHEDDHAEHSESAQEADDH